MISSSRENKRAVTGLDMLAGDGSQYESDTMYKYICGIPSVLYSSIDI
jgi:hypothetical protein